MSGTGKYIVIEGNDGTGKSTQVAKLAEYFRARGQTVCVVEEPIIFQRWFIKVKPRGMTRRKSCG